jgi:hypothetical protein
MRKLKFCSNSFRRGCLALATLTAVVTGLQMERTFAAEPTREDAVLVSITATIEALDHDTRIATLKGPLGNLVTFTVDPRIERLKEFAVGDAVTADYFVSVAYELREPTAEERAEPLVILDAAGKASTETAPAAGVVSQIRAVCTIEGLDRPTETVTLKGPRGRYATVLVADAANLPHLRIGQSVVVTYTEALAVSLEKVEVAAER